MKKTLCLWWAIAPAMAAALACEPRADQGDRAVVSGAQPAPTGAASAGTVLEPTIVWPDRAQIDGQALAALPPAARGAVSRSTVPVLVPAETALLSRASLVVKPYYYALSSQHDGVFVVLHATRLVHRYEHITERPSGRWQVRGQAALVTRNRGIWSASWQEHGASYALELECADPHSDARCADSTTLLALAAELAFVGGADPRAGGAP